MFLNKKNIDSIFLAAKVTTGNPNNTTSKIFFQKINQLNLFFKKYSLFLQARVITYWNGLDLLNPTIFKFFLKKMDSVKSVIKRGSIRIVLNHYIWAAEFLAGQRIPTHRMEYFNFSSTKIKSRSCAAIKL